MDLMLLEPEKLSELVATMPASKRAAFSKAARAASLHLKASRENYDEAYKWASAMVENWWHLGLEIDRLDPKPGRPKNRDKCHGFITAQLGISRKQSQRCRKLAEFSKAELDQYLEDKWDEVKYYLPTMGGATAHSSFNTGEHEWYTPQIYIEAARNVLGGIDLDPASSPAAQKLVKAKTYYTKKADGLSKKWAGRVWMNPPYESGLVDKFVGKLVDAFLAREVSAAIVLVNNSTDTNWFQSAALNATEICFPQGRVKFLDESGEEGAPLQGQALLYFGNAQKRFKEQMAPFGMGASLWT